MILGVFVFGFLALAGTASAQMGIIGNSLQNGSQTQSTQSNELNRVLQSIYASQNVTSQAQVNCSKVTSDQFNRLGDAYMGTMLPNQQQHKVMDNMMGGEGSKSLRQAHINMGRSYLGCWSDYSSGPISMPMMGRYGSYNNGNYPINGMMRNNGWGLDMMGGYSGFAWFGWITMILVWALLILGIAAIVKWLRKTQ